MAEAEDRPSPARRGTVRRMVPRLALVVTTILVALAAALDRGLRVLDVADVCEASGRGPLQLRFDVEHPSAAGAHALVAHALYRRIISGAAGSIRTSSEGAATRD